MHVRPINPQRIEFIATNGEIAHIAHDMKAAEAICNGRGLSIDEVVNSMTPQAEVADDSAFALPAAIRPALEAPDMGVLKGGKASKRK